jgi:hypothetical protein
MKKALIATGFLTCILVANNASAEYDTVPANSITIGKFTLPDFGGGSSGCTNIQFDSAYSGDVVTITPMCYDDPSNPTQLGNSFTVSNGSAGSSGCWSTSWGAYVAPSNCTGRNQDLCKTKGHKDLIIAPTGETGCNYGSGTPSTTTIPFEDKCMLSKFGIAGSGQKGDIYDCTRQDDDSAYQWYSEHAIMTITKIYHETKNGKPGYIENESGDVVLPPTVDKCDPVVFALEDKTANNVTKKVVRATQTCYVGDIGKASNATGNSKTWQTGESYILSGGDLPDDELSYNYYASADGMPGYLVTTKNGVAGPNVYDSICEYEVLARGTQNASTNTTYKAGALKRRCQVQPLPTGTTKHDTNLNENDWYDVAGVNPKELPDDDPYVYKYTRAEGQKGVLTKYTDTNSNGQWDSGDTKVSSTEDYECTNSITAKDTTNKLGGIKQTCKVQNFDKTKTNRPSGAAYEPGYSYDLTTKPIPTPDDVCAFAETGQTKKVTRTYVAHGADDTETTTTGRGYYKVSTTKCGSDTADNSYEYDYCSPAKDVNGLCANTDKAYMSCTQGNDPSAHYQICESLGSDIKPLSKHVDDVEVTAETAKNTADAALPANQLAIKLQAEMTNTNGVLKDVADKANAALPASSLTETAILNKLNINDSNSTLGAALNNKADTSALSGYVAKEGSDANSFATLFGSQLNTAMNSAVTGSLGGRLSAAETAAAQASTDAAGAVSAVANKADKSTLDDYVAKDGADTNSFATLFGTQLNTAMSSTATGSLGKALSDKLSATDLNNAVVDGSATSGTLGAILRDRIDAAVNAMLSDSGSRLSQTIQAAADSRQQ